MPELPVVCKDVMISDLCRYQQELSLPPCSQRRIQGTVVFNFRKSSAFMSLRCTLVHLQSDYACDELLLHSSGLFDNQGMESTIWQLFEAARWSVLFMILYRDDPKPKPVWWWLLLGLDINAIFALSHNCRSWQPRKASETPATSFLCG